MIKNIVISIFICVLSFWASSQEIKLGFVVGTNLYQKITVEQPSFSPSQSYITFISEDTSRLIDSDHAFNAFHIGSKISVLYKRFSFNLEPQFLFKRSLLYFDYPSNIDWILIEKGFRLPLYFTYKVFKKSNSIYLISGLSYTKTKHWDFQSPTSAYNFLNEEFANGNPVFGYNLFEDYLYSQKGYWNILLGVGKKLKKINFALRFQTQFKSDNLAFDTKTIQVEWSVSRQILSSKDITTKHFLYVE